MSHGGECSAIALAILPVICSQLRKRRVGVSGGRVGQRGVSFRALYLASGDSTWDIVNGRDLSYRV